MKIYTSVVIDMATGITIQEESFDHSGPVSLCKGGDNEVKETEQEKELARISSEQWNQYQERFRPFEDEWIANTKMDEGDQAKMAGQVNAGIGAAFDQKVGEVVTSNFQSGMDPSSGRFKAAMRGLGTKRGESAAKATTAASQAVDDQTYQGLQSAVAIGRGQAGGTLRDMTSLASDATSKAITDARIDQQNMNNIGSSIMSAAGMGLAGWKNVNTEPEEEVFNASGYGQSR